MQHTGRYIVSFLLVGFVVILLSGCSTKKNTPMSRFWQAFTTRYNVYYNGMTNYEEQIKVLENDYQDDYTQYLFIHPAEARNFPKSPQPSGSFDRTIEKLLHCTLSKRNPPKNRAKPTTRNIKNTSSGRNTTPLSTMRGICWQKRNT